MEDDAAALEYYGNPCNSPRHAITGAFKMGWIQQGEAWLGSLEARNETSHTYSEATADRVYQAAKAFPALAQELLVSLRKEFEL